MKKLLHKDSIALGVVATLLSELLCALLVLVVIIILQVPIAEGARWFAIAFVPPLLLLRYYAKIRSNKASGIPCSKGADTPPARWMAM